jgi:hypothetical protein
VVSPLLLGAGCCVCCAFVRGRGIGEPGGGVKALHQC